MIDMFLEHFQRVSEYLQGGGIVMPPLMIASLIMWILIINRVFYFSRLYKKNMSRDKAGELIKAHILPDTSKYKGAVALFVEEFLKRKSGKSGLDEHILDETVIIIIPSLDRYLNLIGVLAGIAPLLGLLGTVTGMIATFDIISVFGTGNAQAMAGGISEALISTQTGLLIAIPGMYMHSFLTKRAEILKQRISSIGIYLKKYV